jgi:adenine-specific DNA-methyltransferase
MFARCYVETDATQVDADAVDAALRDLAHRPGVDGYVTETFCVQSRFFQPFNGRRIDGIRDAIESDYGDSRLYPVLLTSLIEAADRVDSTTGVQMAYVKKWAPRSFRPLELRPPELLTGTGRAVRGDACDLAGGLGSFDFAYLDPPYNQHRYFTNYHVWETLVRWDAPEQYGVACKRLDAREPHTRSPFNARATMAPALAELIGSLRARVTIASISDESWVSLEGLLEVCRERGHAEVLTFDSRRYVGAQIGIFNPSGERVGRVSHLRNREHLVVAGERSEVREIVASAPAAAAL